MSPDTDPSLPGESGERGSYAERLRRMLGKDVDPSVSLEKDEPGGPDSPSSELVRRLTAHAPQQTRYAIRGEVARGGMGAILRVWDEDLRRTLAMKVILGKEGAAGESATPPVDERTLGRFLEEAQVTGQLDHPGVVPVHELGLDGSGRVYFTMRLVKGRDLRRIIDLVVAEKEGWTRTKALAVIVKVCEAMAYAHSKGVIHRDLKPGNIMVGRFGETYVMDWGLAKIVGREDRHDIRLQQPMPTSAVRTERSSSDDDPGSPLLTMDGTVVGTPAYMSPEQARGEIERVGVRSDVYSVGAMLYHLLSGQMPYVPPGIRASAHAVWRWVIEAPPRRIQAIRPDLPAELVAICEKAMAREADRRYADTMQMAEDILAYLEGRVVRAYETGAVAELKKWVSRNRGTAAASAAAILLAIGGLVAIGIVQSRGKKDARAGWAVAEQRAAEAKRSAEVAKHESYVANIVAADASLRSREVAEAKRRLDACDEGLRGWEWRHLRLRVDTSLAVLAGHEDGIEGLAVSPDGTRLASGGKDHTVRVWDLAGGRTTMVLRGHEEIVSFVEFSADGSLIASASTDGELRVWDARDGKPLQVIETGTKTLWARAAFSPDGSTIAFPRTTSGVVLWDARTGEARRQLAESEEAVQVLALRPDGSQLVTAALFSRAPRVWDVKSGQPIRLLPGHEQGVSAVAFSRDGTRIATGDQAGVVRVWDAQSGESTKIFRGHVGRVASVRFSPDGEWLASASEDRTVRVWNLRSGRSPDPFLGHDDGVEAVAFTPDGARLVSASSDRTIRVWGIHQSEAIRLISGISGKLNSMAFSSDGTHLLTGTSGSRACVWDTWKEECLQTMDGLDTEVAAVAVTRDGSKVAVATHDLDLDLKTRIYVMNVWDARGGRPLHVRRGRDQQMYGLAFSPDGRRIASAGSDGTVRIWDAESGEELRILKGHEDSVSGVAYSGDGSRIASASSDRTIRLWDSGSGGEQLVLRGHESKVNVVAFGPDDALLLSGSEDRTVRLWDTRDGKCLMVLRGHDGSVDAVGFGPGSSRFVSGSADETVRVWEAQSGVCLLALRGQGHAVTAVGVSPDGSRVASGSWDGNLRLWESSADWIHDPSRDVGPLVDSLFDRFVVVEDVVEHLRKEAALGEALRAEAIRIARSRRDDPETLNTKSWKIVSLSDRDHDSYARALRWAEVAREARPDDPSLLNTLGIAQFRAGESENALATLTRSDQMNGGVPADVAFLAMVQKNLGHAEAAQAELARLRVLMLDPKWIADADSKAFANEAEAAFQAR